MWHQLAHRVGRSSQATPAAVDKFLSASNTKIQITPTKHLKSPPTKSFLPFMPANPALVAPGIHWHAWPRTLRGSGYSS
jgi:hypothetical protein